MDTTITAKIPKAEIGINTLKQVPRKATKLVTEVAMMAPEAFLRLYATLSSNLSRMAGICLAWFHVSLNKNVLSAPMPKIINRTAT